MEADIHYRWNLISGDKDDNKFIDTYVAADADFLVTNDSHFNVLKSIPFPKISVIDISTFTDMLKNLEQT